MSHIFLSYSRRDITLMQRLRQDLEAQGLEVWTDEALTPGTSSWMDSIQDAIDSAGCLVVILTPEAKRSRWVKEEMRYAEAQEVRIFPVMASGDKKRSVPFGFLTAQWVDIRDDEAYMPEIKKLIFTIQVHLGLEDLEKTQPNVRGGTPHEAQKPSTPDRHITFPPDIAKAIMELQNRDNKWWRRVDAIGHLGQLRDKRVIPVLRAFSEDPDRDVQLAARKALGQIRTALELAETSEHPVIGAETLPDTETQVFEELDEETTLIGARMDIQERKAVPKTFKIMVTGPDDDARTRFVNAVSEIEVLTRESEIQPVAGAYTTKISMAFGQITIDEDLVVHLFGTPGQHSFISVWQVMAKDMLGAVILLDGTQPHTFQAVRGIIQSVHTQHPDQAYVIAVDNYDKAAAWPLDDIHSTLRLPAHIKLVPCDTYDPEAVKQVLLELVYLILDNMDEL